jgi:hypothetical protein
MAETLKLAQPPLTALVECGCPVKIGGTSTLRVALELFTLSPGLGP